MRAATASVSTTRCSEAQALASAMASRVDHGHDDAAVPGQRRAAGPSSGSCAATSAAMRWARARLVTMQTARASGSCSACAIRSAATHAGGVLVATIRISVGTGVEVDRAIGCDQRLGGRHPPVAGPDDLVHARHGARPVGHGRHRVRAADAEEAVHAGLECGGEHGGVGARAGDDHLGHAGRACGDRRSSAARRAGDSVRPARSSRPARAARRAAPRSRRVPPRDANLSAPVPRRRGGCGGRRRGSPAATAGVTVRACRSHSARGTSIGPSSPSNRCA